MFNFNTTFEPTVIRLSPGTRFLATTAKQLGVTPRCHIVPAGALYPSLVELETDLVGDIARAVCPEDGE